MASDEPEQAGLDRFDVVPDPNEAFDDVRDYLGELSANVVNRVRDAGIDLDWWSQSPFALDDPSDDVYVYQYVSAYSKGELGSRYDFDGPARTGSPSPEVQFKTGIYVLGEPTEGLREYIRGVHNDRLKTLFDTREYEGYMSGFGFTEKSEYKQNQPVSAREADEKGYGLGVPWFEVEAYDEDGELSGYADGYYNPFRTETTTEFFEDGEEPPQQEVWRVRSSLNKNRSAGGQWDIGPEGDSAASQRTRSDSITGKEVRIGPYTIGTVTQRGTAWLRRRYESGGKYDDKRTITSQSGIPAQALQKGAKLYKYRETEDTIYLSTTKPERDYSPVDPDDVSPDAVGVETGAVEVTEILLDESEPTTFVVETDTQDNLPNGGSGRMLGLYDPVVIREIEYETEFVEGGGL